ncbi:MAG: hypothetical protein KAT58_02665 [candidate division Zixibacteria bacterium]|nr:hypothetical protein [candidate division Zixibacteria bacterium]
MAKIRSLTTLVLILSAANAWAVGFRDDFNRSNGYLGNGWSTQTDGTIQVRIVNNEVLIAGQQATDWARSGLSRAVDNERRISFDFKADDNFSVHIRIDDTEAGTYIDVYAPPGGFFRYASSEDGRWPDWTNIDSSNMIPEQYNTLVLEQFGTEFVLTLNETVIGTITNENLLDIRRVLIAADSAAGTSGSLHIDNVQIGEVIFQTAWDPDPADGAILEETSVTLTWKPGDFAISHDVYFSDNFADVSNGTSDAFRGNQTSASFVVGRPGFAYPNGLIPGTTYYWRIDEVTEAEPDNPRKGDVWSFSIRTFAPNTHPIEMKGVSYTAWQPTAMLSEDSNRSLAKAREDGCDWIALCVWWFQNNVSSTAIKPDYTRFSAMPESVVHAINQCHEQGMKVMLKPMVDCRDGDWRGNIDPSDEWFSAYQEFIAFWAQIAEEHEVELFCIGCELTKTVSWSSSWRNIIQNTRAYYGGALTYAANHGNEKNVRWWNDLDYIGIDAYYPLTNKNNPTLDELKRAWENRANSIENWLNSVWPGKKIIFTEVGYQSVDGTNRTPWYTDPSSHTMDFQEQAECYEALLSVCRRRSWWLGAFWWNWETNPNGGGGNDPYWTPMNKPAEDVMISHYQRSPDSNCSPVEDFEFGDFNTFDWMTFGDEYWFITSDEFNTGNYSAQAGSVANDESSTLEVTLDCIGKDISFYLKVSSESNFDKLIFRIDGIELADWSGEMDWTEVSYTVPPGTHVFKWTYEKDGSVSEGRDTAWIDDIIFPVE